MRTLFAAQESAGERRRDGRTSHRDLYPPWFMTNAQSPPYSRKYRCGPPAVEAQMSRKLDGLIKRELKEESKEENKERSKGTEETP